MTQIPCLHLAAGLPSFDQIAAYLLTSKKTSVADVMAAADKAGKPLIQPRCGVGGHEEMLTLLREILTDGAPDILTITVDSYSRLEFFERALVLAREDASQLNGYPVIAHGFTKLRELDGAIPIPLQIRHGSPDGRRLFAESIAGGIASFEGGAIGYNLPYCKEVPLAKSIACWQEIDECAGMFADAGILIEREMFGSLTGVLVPPSIALSCALLDAMLAAKAGCRCLSLSVPQGGNVIQDVAALRCARQILRHYLPAEMQTHVISHQFMGVFPKDRSQADALIFMGGLVARLGNATKVITKTCQEAIGRPDASANIAALRLTRAAIENRYSYPAPGEEQLLEEERQILSEVREIVDPVLEGGNLPASILHGFDCGRLDIPFPANADAKGEIVPVRDKTGAIRFANTGRLPFSPAVKKAACKAEQDTKEHQRLSASLRESIFYFSEDILCGRHL